MFGLEAVWRDDKVVGHIRRADFGFAIDKTIAYGYIRDPAGGPVSTDPPPPPPPAPGDGCGSFPAAGACRGGERGACLVSKPYAQTRWQTRCRLGSETGQPPRAFPAGGRRVRDAVARWRGRSPRLSLCVVPAMLSGSSAASDVNCNRVFNCSSELTYVIGSNGQ